MTETVTLPRSTAIQLMQQAQNRPEEEVCGLIARGDDGWRVYPVANAAADRTRTFDMEAQALVSAQRAMRERGQTLWGIYHSHPQAAAEPSAADLEQVGYPEAVQIIISLDIRGVLQLRAWRTDGAGARELRLEVRDD